MGVVYYRLLVRVDGPELRKRNRMETEQKYTHGVQVM